MKVKNGFVTILALVFLGVLTTLLLFQLQAYYQQRQAFDDLIENYSKRVMSVVDSSQSKTKK
ncbi:hypothetical protein [Secundilactobacillus muriivasis]